MSFFDFENVNKTIAVDLDGVLAEYEGWKGPEHIGRAYPDAAAAMQRLKDDGYTLIIHTARVCPRGNQGYTIGYLKRCVESWLNKNEIVFDEVWASVGKPPACCYWDDRGLHHSPGSNLNSQLIQLKAFSMAAR